MSRERNLEDRQQRQPLVPELPGREKRDELALPEAEISKAPAATASFLEWHWARPEAATRRVTFSDVLRWAKEEGSKFGVATFELLNAVFTAAIETQNKRRILVSYETGPDQSFNWTSFLNADDEKERKAKEKQDNLSQTTHVERKEHVEKEGRDRAAVRSALTFRPLSVDSSVIKDLEWRLTTKNIPAEEIQDVILFLGQIAQMQPKGLRLVLGSAAS